jgi:hypothetical protein
LAGWVSSTAILSIPVSTQPAKFWILVTGYSMLDKRVARTAQALEPRVALFLFLKLTEYLVNPVSSIQFPASWSITGAAFLSK